MSNTDNTPKQPKQQPNDKGIALGYEILPQQGSSDVEAFMAIVGQPTMSGINLRKTKFKTFNMKMFRAKDLYSSQVAGEWIDFARSLPLKRYLAEAGTYTIVGHYIEPIMSQSGLSAQGYVYGRKDRRNFAIPVDLVILPETEEPMGFTEYIAFQFDGLRKTYPIGEIGLFQNGKLSIEQLTMDQIWDTFVQKGWAHPKKKK